MGSKQLINQKVTFIKVSTILAPSFPGLGSLLNSKSKYSLQAAPEICKLCHQITHVPQLYYILKGTKKKAQKEI